MKQALRMPERDTRPLGPSTPPTPHAHFATHTALLERSGIDVVAALMLDGWPRAGPRRDLGAATAAQRSSPRAKSANAAHHRLAVVAPAHFALQARAVEALYVQAGVVVPASELSWSAARAGGPGGQNVNKVASKVDLRFDVAATHVLPPAAKARLFAIAKGRIDEDGVLRIISQVTRDQQRNLEDARERLAELLRRALAPPPPPRRKTKPTRGSQLRRLKAKAIDKRKKEDRRAPSDE